MTNTEPIVVADGVSYYLWNDGYSVGYRAVNEAGDVEYTYLNASGGSDDGVATVFLYQGPVGEAGADDALSHVTVHDTRELGYYQSASDADIVDEIGGF